MEQSKKRISDEQLVPAIEWVAEQMPGGFFVYRADDSQEILYVNQATYRIFGCESEEEFRELTGNTFYGMVHPEDFPLIQQSIDDQIADSSNENMDYVEYRIIRRDGGIRWVDDYGHYAHLPGYGDVYYVFIGDITEKHLAQEETRRRANIYGGMIARFHAFGDDSLAVMRIDLTTGITEEVRGRDCFREDKPGGRIEDSYRRRMESFLVEGDRERYRDLFLPEKMAERYRKGMDIPELVAYCKRESGRHCFVRFSGTVVEDPETGDLFALYSETDYNTERVTDVLTKKVLSRQYDMVAYIIGTHYGVVIGDTDRVRRGNIFPREKDGNYSAYVEEQVLPVVIGEEQDKRRVRKALSLDEIREKLTAEETYAVEVTCLIDDEIYHKRFTYYPVDRELSFYILLKEDFTEVIRKERLQNELLSNALQEAEQANKAKSNFLSDMSHEIRTPITAILGMNEMIQRASVNDEVLGYADNIEKAGMSLLGIISDILDFSKIEAKRMELVETSYSPKSLILDLVNLSRIRADEKGLLLRVESDPALPGRLIGDELRLKQVITNLLTNAIKYTEKGAVTFSLRLQEIRDETARIEVSVKDTGIGIREEERDRLFQAFDRLDLVKTRTIEGTGLGLAITARLLSLMGSSLSVESSYGEGSCFSFVICQKIADPSPMGEFDALSQANSRKKKRRKSAGFTAPEAKVLIVDDTPMNLEVIAGLLKQTEMKIDTAESGRECIELFGRKEYDLVFLDYRMPELDGIETLRRLRDLYPKKVEGTAVISLTASAVAGDRERMLDAGFDDYLPKPVNIREMEDMICKYLKDKVILEDSPVSPSEEAMVYEEELRQLPGELSRIPQLNPGKGIEFCGGAAEYLRALRLFRESIERRAGEIEESYRKRDWAEYTGRVHALKSMIRSIGAMELSALAETLENAGNTEDISALEAGTEVLLNLYRALEPQLAFLKEEQPGKESLTEPSEEPGEEDGEMTEKAFEGETILLVDDDEDFLTLVGRWLSKDYRVTMQSSGEGALFCLRQTMPDLVLLDVAMPGMSGLEVLKRIRENPMTAELPVMFLTGTEDGETVKAAERLHPAGYLLKSTGKAGLLAGIETFFKNKKAV